MLTSKKSSSYHPKVELNIARYWKSSLLDTGKLQHHCHLKAQVCYFLSNFYFFNKWWPFKNYKKCFLFHQKSSFCSQDIQIFLIFSIPFHTLQIQEDKWEWNNIMMSWIGGLHNFEDIISGITQKPLYITSTNLSDNIQLMNEFF